jgi:pimeloyl-ACP methyl ester carboxylesterase
MSFLNQINYQILGKPTEKTPLVFLHGLMGYALNWRRIAMSFESDRQVLIFDQRGHGKSFKPETGYRPEDYADDLALILDELNWSQIDLVGHSMGGRNALNFAYRFPMRVRRFVMEDMGPEVAPGSMERIQGLINLVPEPFANKLAAKEFFLNEYPRLMAANPQAATLGQYFYANMAERPDGSVSWRFNIKAIMTSLTEGRKGERWLEWESLSTPTLVVRGEKSEDLPRATFEEMLKRNSLCRGVEIPKAGHWVHFDQPEDFIRVLHRFLVVPASF